MDALGLIALSGGGSSGGGGGSKKLYIHNLVFYNSGDKAYTNITIFSSSGDNMSGNDVVNTLKSYGCTSDSSLYPLSNRNAFYNLSSNLPIFQGVYVRNDTDLYALYNAYSYTKDGSNVTGTSATISKVISGVGAFVSDSVTQIM